MKGKVAVVTGGSRGIGFAAARRFLAEGVHVAVADVRDDMADHLCLVGQKAGARALFIRTDVAVLPQVREAGRKVLESFGRLDIWVNNAGWDRVTPFLSTVPADWEKVLGINLMGVIHGTLVALEAMIDGKEGGSIVNLGSDAGRVGSSGEAVYSAAKGGVIAFTKAIAREVAQHGIRVNCLCPGPTDTPFISENFGTRDGEKVIEAIKRGIPFRRLGKPEEIAAAIRFLASDEASYITGQVLSVNGGLNMPG
ncbi:MAG: SDR family NAD(P)-dependent oxidoreductase [Deltaproteobacteria bacterium]|nr:SDR family NAD(P)-dependent oxidoreductase [Deltaproteobacteria bacterium]